VESWLLQHSFVRRPTVKPLVNCIFSLHELGHPQTANSHLHLKVGTPKFSIHFAAVVFTPEGAWNHASTQSYSPLFLYASRWGSHSELGQSTNWLSMSISPDAEPSMTLFVSGITIRLSYHPLDFFLDLKSASGGFVVRLQSRTESN
jgi:hypothetical protein